MVLSSDPEKRIFSLEKNKLRTANVWSRCKEQLVDFSFFFFSFFSFFYYYYFYYYKPITHWQSSPYENILWKLRITFLVELFTIVTVPSLCPAAISTLPADYQLGRNMNNLTVASDMIKPALVSNEAVTVGMYRMKDTTSNSSREYRISNIKYQKDISEL